MRALYDHYFACHDYDRRYPRPNPRTLRFVLEHGGAAAGHVLDFGCGSGRYALALLHRTDAQVTGYDISGVALAEFAAHAHAAGLAQRAHPLGHSLDVLADAGPFDLALMLFGVLGHVGARAQRQAALRAVRARLPQGAGLVLSVPNRWRRRPLELLRAWLHAAQAQTETGSLWFERELGGQRKAFFYHLYTVHELRQELAEAGFALRSVGAESILPEWWVTQHPRLGRLDAWLARHLPAVCGYGLLAHAQAVEEFKA